MALENFANFIPKASRESICSSLKYSGFEGDCKQQAGKIALYSMVAGAALFVLSIALFSAFLKIFDSLTLLLVSVILAIVGYFAFIMVYGLGAYYSAEARARKVEGILPDFLLLIANNIRSGLTPFAAFRQSARPEFGVLSEEAKLASAKSLGAQSFEKALQQLGARIDSRMLRDTVSLFAQSLKSGSHLAKLLESCALDLRRMQELRKEMVSSVRTYVLFVAFVALIATPLLLAISIQFLSMLQGIQAEQALSTTAAQVSFINPHIGVSASTMQSLSFILLLGNSLFAGLFLGVLNKGKLKHGLRYFIPIAFASIMMFFAFQYAVSRLFTSFFAMG